MMTSVKHHRANLIRIHSLRSEVGWLTTPFSLLFFWHSVVGFVIAAFFKDSKLDINTNLFYRIWKNPGASIECESPLWSIKTKITKQTVFHWTSHGPLIGNQFWSQISNRTEFYVRIWTSWNLNRWRFDSEALIAEAYIQRSSQNVKCLLSIRRHVTKPLATTSTQGV